VFEIERLRTLIDLMREHDITEIDLREGTQRIRLARGGAGVTVESAAVPRAGAGALSAQPRAEVPATTPAGDGPNIAYIRSPMVGTFYARPNPNAEPFVRVGDHVEPEKTVCIVEAMKMFNEIPAEVRGKIVAILVGEEEPVDHGKPLFKVDTSS
jgi:acetyl-CoA carboxylase biotin carboxyl carrier protein